MQKVISGRGFTLIELLLVISIIGLLSSIVLAALSSAKGKGRDTAIIQQMNAFRSAADLYLSDNGNYGSSAGNVQLNYNSCPSSGSTNYGVFYSSSQYNLPQILGAIKNQIIPTGLTTDLSCNMTSGSGNPRYALNAKLSDGSFWCVDNTGSSKNRGVGGTLGVGIYTC